MALELMCVGVCDPDKYGLVYRAKKDINDVGIAIRKAKKNGRQKMECELSMLECYLGDVFKAQRTRVVA